MDSSGPDQGITNRRSIRPEGPNDIENYSKYVEIGPGSAGTYFWHMLNLFCILFGPSGLICLLFFIPWPGLGLCNDGVLLRPVLNVDVRRGSGGAAAHPRRGVWEAGAPQNKAGGLGAAAPHVLVQVYINI